MPLITPITDRTQADVNNAAANPGSATLNKGALNIDVELNRIENNCSYLAGQLNSYGYPASITVKTDWTRADKPTQTQINRIRSNINALISAFYLMPGSPSIIIHDSLDFVDMNSLEKNIENIDTLLQRMIASFWYCGELYGGER